MHEEEDMCFKKTYDVRYDTLISLFSLSLDI